MKHTPTFLQKTYGLLSVLALAITSIGITSIPVISKSGLSSLVIAIVLGIIIGNVWHHPHGWAPGIQFAAKRLLRLAIILYGFHVTFQQIASVGIESLIIDLLVVTLTLIGGYWIGKKIFKLDSDLSLLISAGSAICGAAAVLAVEDVINSEPYKAAVAVGTVVLFGTTAMFIFPLLQHAGLFGFTDNQFGVFAGASIHEVAQALVAGTNVSSEAGKIAVIVKMMRVLLLIPVLIFISVLYQRKKQTQDKKVSVTIPWFAIGFAAVIGFNSLHLLATSTINTINQIDILLLTMAMGAIGMETKFSKIRQVGIKPLYHAFCLFLWLLVSVAVMVTATTQFSTF